MRRPGGRAPLDRSTSVARYRFDTATAICMCCPRRSVLQRPIIVVGEAVTEPIVRRLRAGGNRIRTCMGHFLSSGLLVCWRFFVRSAKVVLRPVACDQVRGAGGRGQGTETVA